MTRREQIARIIDLEAFTTNVGGTRLRRKSALAKADQIMGAEGEADRIGPRPRPSLFVCKGCPAYETQDWREPSGDGETYDTGQYAWCNAADHKSMGAYHYDHTPRPDWCPALKGPTHD